MKNKPVRPERRLKLNKDMIRDLKDFFNVNAVRELRQIAKEMDSFEEKEFGVKPPRKQVVELVSYDKNGEAVVEKILSEAELDKWEAKIDRAKPNKQRINKLVESFKKGTK